MTDERRIMDERARVLARRVNVTVEAAGAELLFFSIGEEQMAIEVRFVLEIVALPEVTPVPDLPPAFLGVVNHNGEILPVIDLGVLTSDRPMGQGAKLLVILGEHRREIGLAVHQTEQIATPTDIPTSTDSSLIRGVLDGQRVLVDGGALLCDPRLFLTS